MSRPNQDIVYEGWLTKSPPSKRVWRAKWRRRWFVLRQSGELPGQYFLDYYTDRKSRRKGSIDLDLCEQLDAGLRMQRRSSEGSTLRGSVFSIRTQSRVYHLEADCVTEMEKWVDIICRACGLRSTEEDKFYTRPTDNATAAQPPISGPYIAMYECFTGPPNANNQDGDTVLIYISNQPDKTKTEADSGIPSTERSTSVNSNQAESIAHANNPSIDRTQLSKNPVNPADSPAQAADDSADEEARQIDVLGDTELRGVVRSMPRLSLADCIPAPGTPMPPRPPKPSHLSLDIGHKESFVGPRIHEPTETTNPVAGSRESHSGIMLDEVHRLRHNTNQSSTHFNVVPPTERGQVFRYDIGQEETAHSQYRNVYNPPVVNRGLKPGWSRGMTEFHEERPRPNRVCPSEVQYIDLDLNVPKADVSPHLKQVEMRSPTIYKTVDFLKTKALQDINTETSRHNDIPQTN